MAGTDSPVILMFYPVMLMLFLMLLVFVAGWWFGDWLIMQGIRRQAHGGVIWENDRVVVQDIPPKIDRNQPWLSAVWQEQPGKGIAVSTVRVGENQRLKV